MHRSEARIASSSAPFASRRRAEHSRSVFLQALDLGSVEVAGVGEQELWLLIDAGLVELRLGGLRHRLETVALVRSLDQLGGDDHLALARSHLGGVALDEAGGGLDRLRVGIGDVDAAGRLRRQRARLLRVVLADVAGLSGVLCHRQLPGGHLGLLDRLLLVELSLGVAKPLLSAAAITWELVASLLPELFVLGRINRVGLFEDLVGELLIAAVLSIGGIGLDPGAVKGERSDRDQACLSAEDEE